VGATRCRTESQKLVTPVVGLLLALQGLAPDVRASVDRTRLRAGEQLTLTVRAQAPSAEPVSLTLPPLTGFAILGSRDVSEVLLEGGQGAGPARTTTREVQLRAERPGTLVIGPVRARQGAQVVATDPITIIVDSAGTGVATSLSPRLRAVIGGTPPPRHNDRVALSVILPGDTVLAGAQLDVVAGAWFPREVRTRLRRAPVLTLQTPEGVWSYPGAAPATVAASRLVNGGWMDLFVAHLVVFPLAPGRVVIPPATVEYALPVTFSLFSREERYSLRSDSVAVAVLPLPETGRPANDQGVVGQGLTLAVQIDPAQSRVGEALDVTAKVSGVGNVALWPEPGLRWPPGFRAYPGQTGMRLEPGDGRIAGSKSFYYLIVPDSAGSFLLPEVRYSYYDVTAGTYAVARLPARALAVAPGAEPRAARPSPPLPDALGLGGAARRSAARRRALAAPRSTTPSSRGGAARRTAAHRARAFGARVPRGAGGPCAGPGRKGR
jgi:oxygen tolerance protein BatD